MPNKPCLLISIDEFVEPRDFGEITVSYAGRVLARKSNVPLYGDPQSIRTFIAANMSTIRSLGEVEVAFENVSEGVRQHILGLLNAR